HLAKMLLAEPIQFRDRNLKRLADADRVELERGERRGPAKAVFAKVDGNWKMTAPVESDAEQADLDDFLNALLKLRADELVAEKPADLKPFGLDRPEASWKLFLGDREVLHLVVGGKEADGQRRYAKLGNGDLVFLLDPALTNRAAGEYRKRALWA